MVALGALQMVRAVVEQIDPLLLPPQVARGQEFRSVISPHRDLTAQSRREVADRQAEQRLLRRLRPHVSPPEHGPGEQRIHPTGDAEHILSLGRFPPTGLVKGVTDLDPADDLLGESRTQVRKIRHRPSP